MDFVFRNKQGNYIDDEQTLLLCINNNSIVDYCKIPLFKVGEYVTCCGPGESLKQSNDKDRYKGGNWKLGKVFRVKNCDTISDTFGVYGNSVTNEHVGVYIESIRMATQEEITAFQEKEKQHPF